MEQMVSEGAVLGGEDSGHIIFLDQHTTGDGLLASLKLLDAVIGTHTPLSEAAKVMRVFPQCLINVDVQEKRNLSDIVEITEIISRVEKELADHGRVLVRYSGTQPQCRVMVEGPTQDLTIKYCQQIAEVVKNKLG